MFFERASQEGDVVTSKQISGQWGMGSAQSALLTLRRGPTPAAGPALAPFARAACFAASGYLVKN